MINPCARAEARKALEHEGIGGRWGNGGRSNWNSNGWSWSADNGWSQEPELPPNHGGGTPADAVLRADGFRFRIYCKVCHRYAFRHRRLEYCEPCFKAGQYVGGR